MKIFTSSALSVVIGAFALAAASFSPEDPANDYNDASGVRDLARNGRWDFDGDNDNEEGRSGRRHHGDNGRNHTGIFGGGGRHKGNHTAFLEEKCTAAEIVCDDVKEEELADCGDYTSYRVFRYDSTTSVVGDTVEDGTEVDETELEDSTSEDGTSEDGTSEDGDTLEDEDGDLNRRLESHLRGSSNGVRNLHRHRPHGGNFAGGGGGKWGNLTSAEIEEIKAKRLLCKCCAEVN